MRTYIVGRGDSADIKLDDASVSREHLSITGQQGRWLIRDLQSNNGTYVLSDQGTTEISEAILDEREELLLGQYRVRLADLTAGIAPPQPQPTPQSEGDSGRPQNANFSRYVRTEDGRYARKGK